MVPLFEDEEEEPSSYCQCTAFKSTFPLLFRHVYKGGQCAEYAVELGLG